MWQKLKNKCISVCDLSENRSLLQSVWLFFSKNSCKKVWFLSAKKTEFIYYNVRCPALCMRYAGTEQSMSVVWGNA